MSAVLVIAEHRGGVVRPVTREIVAAALAVREGLGARVEVAIIGARPDVLVPALSLEESTSCCSCRPRSRSSSRSATPRSARR